jgi:cell wall assembly regulator SMI1
VRAAARELQGWMRAHRPDLAAGMRGPASAADIAVLRGMGLSAAWLALWETFDGAGPFLYEGWHLMPVQGAEASVVSETDALAEMADALEEEDPPEVVGPVLPLWADRRWVPFATDFSGCLLCVDLVPDEGGQPGQVILLEDAHREVLHPGPAELLTEVLRRLRAGESPEGAPPPAPPPAAPPAPAPAPSPLPPPPPKGPPRTPEAEPEPRGEVERVGDLAELRVELRADEAARGGVLFFRDLEGRVLGARLPAGARAGARLRLAGLGGEGLDLQITVTAVLPGPA